MSVFQPATRAAVKAKIALAGPSGSGKTYTALSMAQGFSGKTAVIDTEHGSASMYVGLNGWQFDTVTPDSFAPDALTGLLGEASGAGYEVVIVDSLSHYWMGVDGMLEQVDRRTKGSSSFSSGWKDMRPAERRMIEALVAYPGHVIVTLRTKTEWLVEKDPQTGKSKPVKVGLKPEQREGLDYEFSVFGELDLDHVLSVSKTRIPFLSGAVIANPDQELAEKIAEWLADGEELPTPAEYRTRALATGMTFDELRALHTEAKKAGQLGAPVVDEDGIPTTLGDLIVARGTAAREGSAA